MTDATDLSTTLQSALGPQYRLERELGRGGMGVVFLATDLTLDRPVAVKAISPEMALNRALADRFLAEARLIARLRHPNIVTVYAAGAAEGLLYYVMDHVPGDSLRDLLQREGRLAPELAARLAAQIAAALDAAGRAGVVHRDIKPENILVEQTSAGPRAMLADFGIAHAMWGEANHTGPGVAMGTPAYMSPEQASGEPVDGRSDIYSLGVVAWEMLAGHPPFQGNRRSVVSQQIVDPPPPLGRIRPDAPAVLIAAIERALDKVPEDRWQTGDAFRSGLLGRMEAPSPVPGRKPGSRRPAPLVMATILLLAGLALAFAWLGSAQPPRGIDPRHSFLVLPFDNLRDDEGVDWLASGSVSMLDLALGQWRELRVVSHERVRDLVADTRVPPGTPFGLDRARRMAREAGVWTVVMGEFERTRDSLHIVARAFDVATGARLEVAEVWGHLGDDVRPLFDELAAKLLDLSGAPPGSRAPLATVTSPYLEAYRAYLRGVEALNQWNLVDAEVFFSEAVTVDSSFALAFFRLAQTRGWMSTAVDTLTQRYLAEATRHGERLPERERQMIAAYRALIEGDLPQAQSLYAGLVTRDSTDADAWYGLGDAWFHDLRADRADAMTRSLRAFQRALALDRGYGLAYDHVNAMLTTAAAPAPYFALQEDGRFVRTRDATGRGLLSSAALDASVARARQQAIAAARGWTEYQPQILRAHRALMEAYLASGDSPGALAQVARIRELSAEGARPLADFLEARIRLRLGDATLAAEILRRALSEIDPVSVRPNDLGQEVISDILSGANVFAYLGDLEGAEAVIRIADQLRRTVLPPGAIVDAYGDDRVWENGRLSSLYSAVGGPAYELRDLWQRVSRVARGATDRERPVLAWAGAAAAQGLLVGPAADPSAIEELQTLTGMTPRPEFRALAAITRGDSAAARAALAEEGGKQGTHPSATHDRPSMGQAAAFAMGDPRPVAAEVRFQLGDYAAALELLETLQPDVLGTRSFDPRWGLLARVHLLRGLSYEKLGQVSNADREYREVISQWEGADQRLLPVVEAARAGLIRIRAAKG